MTNEQAAAKAKKRWGNKAFVRNSGHFSSQDRRDKARQTVTGARARIKEIDEEIARRLSELDWFQELSKEKREARKQISATEGDAFFYRFTVGTSSGMFNSVAGQGDTWEEAFAKADARSKVA